MDNHASVNCTRSIDSRRPIPLNRLSSSAAHIQRQVTDSRAVCVREFDKHASASHELKVRNANSLISLSRSIFADTIVCYIILTVEVYTIDTLRDCQLPGALDFLIGISRVVNIAESDIGFTKRRFVCKSFQPGDRNVFTANLDRTVGTSARKVNLFFHITEISDLFSAVYFDLKFLRVLQRGISGIKIADQVIVCSIIYKQVCPIGGESSGSRKISTTIFDSFCTSRVNIQLKPRYSGAIRLVKLDRYPRTSLKLIPSARDKLFSSCRGSLRDTEVDDVCATVKLDTINRPRSLKRFSRPNILISVGCVINIA